MTTDKEWCSEMFARAAQDLDQGITPEKVCQHIDRDDPGVVAAFELGQLYFAGRAVRGTRKEPGEN